MNKSFKRLTAFNFIWFLVYIAPFLAWLFLAISNNGIQVSQRSSLDSMFIGFQYVVDKNNIFLNLFVDFYKVVSQNSNFTYGPNIESFLIIICYWVLLVSLFRIVVDLLLVVPRVCQEFLHKLTKESEK